jgi:hypothetical protein
MKPIQGIVFGVGPKRGVGYFYNKNSNCKLVLTLAEEPRSDDPQSFTAIRHEVAVPVNSLLKDEISRAQRLQAVQGRSGH